MEKAVPGITKFELVSILSRVGSSPYPSAIKSYLEENIDALRKKAEMNARANRAVVVERDDDNDYAQAARVCMTTHSDLNLA
ncbi:unnamed protein product [Aureobasidium pullulans]|nr:unnamed protein product [Aureobasidium pullulans]